MHESSSYYSLDDAVAPDVVGGKAAGLKRLQALRLNVPPAVLLPLEAREEVAAATAAALASRLDAVLPSDSGWAVRSSAVDEDDAKRSQAGLYETVVIQRPAELVEAIRRVRRSGEASGLPAGRMGVIVQRFIEPDYAGVVLSADPVTGERAAVVEVVQGRGQRLVSGEASPWRYWERSGWEGAAPPSRDLDAAVSAVAAEAKRTADGLGCEQDMEWAIRDGVLFFLQARPMTGGPRRPFTLAPEVAGGLLGHWFLMEHSVAPVAPLVESLDPGGYFRLHDWESRVVNGYHFIQLQRKPPARVPSTGEEVWNAWVAIETKYSAALIDRAAVDLPGLSEAVLWEELQRRIDLNRALVGDYLDTGFFALRARAAKAVESFVSEARAAGATEDIQLGDLLGGLETRTTKKQRRLRELAEIAREAPDPLALGEWNDARFRHALASFLADYGFESANTVLFYLPTLAETPDLLMAIIANLLSDAEQGQGTRGHAAREVQWGPQAELLSSHLEPAKREAFASALHTLRLCMLRTEDDDYLVQRGTALVRAAILESGRRLRRAGIVLDVDDVFFLLGAELHRDLVEGAREPEGSVLAERKRSFKIAGERRPPQLIQDGRVVVAQQPPSMDGFELKGQAASPGVAEGPAIVVVNPVDRSAFKRVPRGAVLVTRVLTPAMSYGLTGCRAVVAEMGGLASHAAIVARELGIPAVVGVADATRRVRPGTTVFVDGSAGVIKTQR